MYFWAEDNTHIVYLQDEGGDENWRVHAVDASTKEDRDLTPFDDVQAQIVESSRHFPDTLLVALNRENPELHDVYRLTLSTGDLDLVARNPGSAVGWVVDAHLRVRAAMTATPDGGFDLLLRDEDGEDADWRKVLGWGKEDALSSAPVGFTEDGEKMYLIDSRGANASRLVLLDLENGATQTLVDDQRYDVGQVVTHPETHEAQAVAVERARTEWVVLDGDIREDFAIIESLGRGDFVVTSRDRADESWLVVFTADEGGASYYAYDRKNRRGEHLFDARPDLAEYTLARMEPVSFTSRDGLTIEGYLTLPPTGSAGPMPMVLNVHGGPWVRDGWGYDPEAQWFANRGYACLQVNYRGSTGYGKAFLNAGNKEWAGTMHDDLVDAVAWAVERGVADPERVAIYGGSYGGYAALVGATFTPDLFRCAVDIVGPSSLITLINSIPPYWKPLLATFHERVGNPDTEEDFLKVPLSPVLRGPHQDTDAHSPGRQRPPRETGRVRANSRRHEGERHRPRIPALRGRRPRLRPSREPPEVLRSRRTLPGQTPRRSRRRMKRVARRGGSRIALTAPPANRGFGHQVPGISRVDGASG